MYKAHKICVKCWRKEKYCKCNNKRLELIDHNMVYIVTHLNKKGYKTKFSCGGHVENKFIYIYIRFYNNYAFDTLPEGFVYKNGILFYKNMKLKNKKEMQADINHKIKVFKAWVKTLNNA